MSNIPFFSRMS